MSEMKKVLVNKEEQVNKGSLFIIKIPKIDIKSFAMIVTTLVNIKSSMKERNILDVSTAYGSNDIIVTFSSDEKEENRETLKYAVGINTLDVEYNIEFDGDVEIVTIYGSDLKDAGLIKDEFEVCVKVEY